MLLYQSLELTIDGKKLKINLKNRFKISAPTWNEEWELDDGSYYVSDIHDYFEYIIQKHEKVTDNA